MKTIRIKTTDSTPASRDVPLVIGASPHLKGRDSIPRIMWNVVGAMVPIVAAATWFFGPSALLVVAASVAGAFLTEHYIGRRGSLMDGSAAITGILLGLTLPAGIPLWMPFLGGAFAIGIGKLLFGGLGYNIFNPALLGRAFLQAAFPVAITTWPAVTASQHSWWSLRGDNLALPFMGSGVVDAVTAATPLGLMKFEHKPTGILPLLIGNTGGSLAPHLHFHIVNGANGFTSDGYPYVLRSFALRGQADPALLTQVLAGKASFPHGREKPAAHKDELPLNFNIVDFPK